MEMSESDYRPTWILDGPGLEQLDSEKVQTLSLMLSGLGLQLTRARRINTVQDSAAQDGISTPEVTAEDKLLKQSDFQSFAEKTGRRNFFGVQVFNALWRERTSFPGLIIVDENAPGWRTAQQISLLSLRKYLPVIEENKTSLRNIGSKSIEFMKEIIAVELDALIVETD
jgi:hypothetical protein